MLDWSLAKVFIAKVLANNSRKLMWRFLSAEDHMPPVVDSQLLAPHPSIDASDSRIRSGGYDCTGLPLQSSTSFSHH